MFEKILNALVDNYEDNEFDELDEAAEEDEELLAFDEEDNLERDQFIEDPGIVGIINENSNLYDNP
ncbi:hypothetical protein [Sediminibacillus albus]|uniref:Uncharacterized protein n=1 Tax=Sediminibacillus albus TaxID=407036 RepID=A0A1G8YHN3_9BACI|nr:hypothetical protein [Sediminibacillus albus]SDK01600.1 hypothetical protein SAMN05216243_1588 [Sediminibacillus albus]